MTLIPSEGAVLPLLLPSHFEAFYRGNLRQVRGARIRARDLMIAYDRWATANAGPRITFAAMKRLMANVGHRRVQSNGIHYDDLALACDVPDVSDTLPSPFRGVLAMAPEPCVPEELPEPLLAKVDAALAALLDLRRALLSASDRQDPATAAARIVASIRQG